jgi:hypothetical protein
VRNAASEELGPQLVATYERLFGARKGDRPSRRSAGPPV